MRPSSLGGGRILRRTLSVCPSVCPSVRLSVRPDSGCTLFTVAPSYERTSKIEKLRFSLMGHRHVCTFRHAQRAAYRTAISAAQILVTRVTSTAIDFQKSWPTAKLSVSFSLLAEMYPWGSAPSAHVAYYHLARKINVLHLYHSTGLPGGTFC